MDAFSTQYLEGYPSFVRWSSEDSAEMNWWAPERTGDTDADYATGMRHLNSAIDMFKGMRDPSSIDYYRGLMPPGRVDPRIVLTNIVRAMRVSGPMECGFIVALAQKAMAGRQPIVGTGPEMMAEDQFGEEHADACIELSRMAGDPGMIVCELTNIIDDMTDASMTAGFIWTVCSSALSGALN